MNLLKDPWLPFRTRGGSIAYRSPSAISDPNIVDLALPRADFQGAAYQFLIGLLQTVYPPQDYGEWVDRSIEPPGGEALDEAFVPFAQAFEFQGDGPRFMQDLDPLADAKPVSVAKLLIDSPSVNGLEKNKDHFVKRGRVVAICEDCAALALFTMQVNGPFDGRGTRVGLRGGGPLTTLIVPDQAGASLWQRLWLNVMPIEAFSAKAPIRDRCPDDDTLFPWVGATRASGKNGNEVLPEQMHPMYAYWAMPRRIRLEVGDDEGCCDLCGRKVLQRVSEIRTKSYGAKYDGPWQHPLTPYRRNPQKPNELPLSTKGRADGLGYRHWSNLVLSDEEGSGALPAGVMHDYFSHKVDFVAQELRAGEDIDALLKPRLWIFGYDMDQAKLRGWCSEELPLVVVPAEQQARLRTWVQTFIELARQTAETTRKQVKNAWFSRHADAKGDLTSVDSQFYEATQAAFFRALRDMQLALQQGEGPHMPSQVARAWYHALRKEALTLFEAQALNGPFSELDMKRVTRARRQLLSWLSGRSNSKGSKIVSQFAKDGGFTLTEAQGNAPTEEAVP
ncbi:type I-E CRISPR-associated protein Cse1/CasA [Cobetia sp. 10Alg 146]|uniref:type I-E CRISPR-associated protein Cse1/CasA n=1 Tax=Cobetia sp. 10Alg 146 TaxID=3040019 RepID=UPI0024490649|nr:type I-E CRISPR-associated protein Cse1/CasA [Cobetia sp. 10Alg 146]MDH2291578.1 type I-E CRISPR-associated protein Cse1/CasA [Cobetia sp. 10Alg 146]